MTRKELLDALHDPADEDAIRDSVSCSLDDIENRVNSALDSLGSIKGIGDLHLIDECRKELEQLSRDLY